MYSYIWDRETGGFVLNSAILKNSLEPRPVYYQELDLLGFDKFWNYPKNDMPIMWAEATSYIYRGRKIAKITGGGIFTAPTLEIYEYYPEGTIDDISFLGINVAKLSKEKQKDYVGYEFSEASFEISKGNELQSIDMSKFIERNKTMMDGLVNNTIKELYNTYKKYKEKVDIFQVAFSGGKDSIVLLDLVKRAIPEKDFIVVFADTQMEFPDTYALINRVEFQLKKDGITFLRSKSNLGIMDSWERFGPPSNSLRWCCSVHKTTPKLLKIREYLGKPNVKEMAFVGVRADESLARSEYEPVNQGSKYKGQYASYPILQWNSAEVWLYKFINELEFNQAYQKGNSRAGCLVCPMASGVSEYVRQCVYPTEVKKFINKINQSYGLSDVASLNNISAGGWRHRKNGRMLFNPEQTLSNTTTKDKVFLHFPKLRQDWKEWMKTLGELKKTGDTSYEVFANEAKIVFNVRQDEGGYEVEYSADFKKNYPQINKIFKQVFIKASTCSFCKTCVANCQLGRISMDNGTLKIDNCVHCLDCHKIEDGCLQYQNIRMPEVNSMSMSINCYNSHGPKLEWLKSFFNLKEKFLSQNDLGTQQVYNFQRFLKHADLMNGNEPTTFAKIIAEDRFDECIQLALILVNLSYTPQVSWYLRQIENRYYSREEMLSNIAMVIGENSADRTWQGYVRLIDLFSQLGFGSLDRKGNRVLGFTRNKWEKPEPLVVLYSLYKMAEANGIYQYNLERLLDFTIEDEGISPAQIFGFDVEAMADLLRGLRSTNSDFVSYSETHGMRTLDLKRDKTSQDVLEVF